MNALPDLEGHMASVTGGVGAAAARMGAAVCAHAGRMAGRCG